MKWTRKKMLAKAKAVAKAANIRDLVLKQDDEAVVKFYLEALTKGVELEGLESEESIRAAVKQVVISFSDDDDVVVNKDPNIETEEDVKAEEGEEDDEDDDEDSETKSLRLAKQAKHNKQASRGIQKGIMSMTKGHGSSRQTPSHKRYDQKAKRGETVFSDSSTAEIFAANERLKAFGWNRDYAQKDNDLRIIEKAGSTFNNADGGVLIRDGYSDQLIELLPKFGTAREYAGVYDMGELREFIPRFGSDVVTYKLAEGLPANESKPSFDGVWLNGQEIGSLARMPLRLLEHAAIDVADAIARSVARSQAKFEDQAYWNSASGFEGISSKIGSNNTFTVTGVSSYIDITPSDAQKFISMLPDWTNEFDSPELDGMAIYCHKSFDDQVFQRFGPAAGGASTVDMVTGRIKEYKGIAIRHVNVMPNARTFVSGKVMAYVGPLSAATKFGEVSGSRKVLESDQRYMEYRQWATLNSVEIAMNPHNVSDDSESGIWALAATS